MTFAEIYQHAWFADLAYIRWDINTIVVKRLQTHGGRHEIGQDTPVAEHIMSFTLPVTKQRITWKSTTKDE